MPCLSWSVIIVGQVLLCFEFILNFLRLRAMLADAIDVSNTLNAI